MSYKEILFFIVVLLANIIQCITGFAGTVLAMPFSLMLVGYGVAKPILNVLGVVASVGVIAKSYKSVNIKELIKISVIMLIGMLSGGVITNKVELNEGVLYKLLGAIVIAFMLLGCYTTFIKERRDKKSSNDKNIIVKNVISFCILALAGLVHGMFVCGGPLLVVYASEKLKDKDEFRATLSVVWIILNSLIMFSDVRSGYFNSDMLVLLAISIGILVFAILIGNKVAQKMNRNVFMTLTYILMGISGLSLILK